MEINIYSDYKLKIQTDYTYISENSTPNDVIYNDDSVYKETVLNGGMLLDLIGNYLILEYISKIEINNNKVIIEKFNPDSGEYSTRKITIIERKINNELMDKKSR